MAKRRRSSKGRKKRRRAAGLFVLENMQTGEMTVSTGSQFDAGYVKRKTEPDSAEKPLEYRKKYRAITPARRIPVFMPTPDDDASQAPKPPSWVEKIVQTLKAKKT